MLAAKITIKELFLFLLPIFCTGQNIEGKYSSNEIEILFQNNRFQQNLHAHFGPSIMDCGYYFVVKDTLFKFYDNPVENKVIIEKRKRRLDSLGQPFYDTRLSIKVMDNEGNDFPGVSILLRSGDNRALKGFIPDKQGKIKITLTPFTEVDNILFSWFTDEVQVDLSDLKGWTSEINVRLNRSNVKNGNAHGVFKFIIIENNKKILRLKDIKSDSIFIYNKVH